ncbi:ead/Ea22-like family protein [Serratia sp. IR-2025]
MDKFSELKAAAIAATPGQWILDDDSWSEGDNANVSTEERYDGRIVSIAQIEGGGSESGFDEPFSAEQQANARYIAAANPAVVLALLAELEAKDERIGELEAIATEYAGKFQKAQDAAKHLIIMNDEDKKRISELESEGKVWESAALKHLARAEEAEKCLPILEQDKLRLNEIINSEANRADEAEKRLATPVVINLPERRDDSYGWYGVSSSEAFNTCRSICGLMFRQQLRAAGFTVEGDE